jgi:RNA polymerase sigma factor (sigma-70 family)
MLRILFILINLINFTNSYLTNYQWSLINKIIINKNTPLEIKNKVNEIIFNNYKDKVSYESHLFRKKNFKHLRKIQLDEIKQYGYLGLFKAIKNYNGYSNFYSYAKIYIHSELLRSISELSNTNLEPHKYKSQNILKNNFTKINYGNDEWLMEKFAKKNTYNKINNLQIYEIHETILNLEPFTKKIFYYRFGYNLDEYNKINKICELMCCSDETVRLELNKCIQLLRESISFQQT